MEKIFNYYYTTKEKGMGLGLPIAHRIIEAHGGQLRIASKVGVGTKVTITLPNHPTIPFRQGKGNISLSSEGISGQSQNPDC
jgi:signal transduction histidine kinase